MVSDDSKKKNKKAKEVNPWTDKEMKALITAYNNGKSRAEIAILLSRTIGSVANKTRLFIQSGRLSPRRLR